MHRAAVSKSARCWTILNYEIQMYLAAYVLQRNPPLAPPRTNAAVYEQVMTSALTELKALHIRILLELFEDKRENGNLGISHALPCWAQEHATVLHNLMNAYETPVEIKDGKRSPRSCFNKYLAHPDKHRGEGFAWTPVIQRIEPYLQDALRTLPRERIPAFDIFGFR